MKSYLDWMDSSGFYARNFWNPSTNRMESNGRLYLFPFQRDVMGYALQFDENGTLKFETVLYSTIKKSGKTTLGGSVGAWYAECGPAGSEIYCIANDLESAEGRLMSDMKFHFKMRIEREDTFLMPNGKTVVLTEKNCKITQYRIELPNGSFIQALAQSYKSVAGSRHALTLWDELWGVTSELNRRTWDEMTPIPTVPNSLRFISTYAGFMNESDLLYDMYLRGVGPEEHEHGRGVKVQELGDNPCWVSGKTFTYWCHDPMMPWQTPEYYEEQMLTERPAAFLRLHMNQWVTSHESFIPIEWWDNAAKSLEGPATIWASHPYASYPITIAVDAGIRHDSTSLVAVAYDALRGRVGIVTHKIWVPTPNEPVDLDATVEVELQRLYNRFNVASIVYDPTQLIQLMSRLKQKGLPTRPFEQTIPNMTAASQLFYDLLKSGKLEAYPDDDLRKHIQMAVAETSARGFRIVKQKASRKHLIDAAVAMAMACHESVTNGGVDISIPVIVRSPFSDMTTMRETQNTGIPFELQ